MSARKHLEEIPNSSGIYQIRCNQNGKIYVGSAVSLQARWCMHRRELRRGLHHNPHLQHAWNLHGEASFEFTILELVEAPQLLIREQWWISQTRCTPTIASASTLTCKRPPPAMGSDKAGLAFATPLAIP